MDERDRPIEVERETTVINTGGGDRGGGGTVVALLVVFLLGLAAFLWFGGYLQSAADDVDINVNVAAPKVEIPKVELPDIKIETPPAREEPPANNKAK